MSLLCCTGLYLHAHITYGCTGIKISSRDREGGRDKKKGEGKEGRKKKGKK